jgi:hypothetical protein
MNTVITINGTAYAASDRANARFNAIDEMTLSLDGYSTADFTIEGVGPAPLFHNGVPVSVATDGTTRLVGSMQLTGHVQTANGWAIRFHCVDLRAMADWITITASDGSGNAIYNRNPGDSSYVPSDAGLSVGTILQRILTISANATALNAIGVGAYTSLSPPTLPTATANLTVVPPRPVVLSGEALFDELDQLVRHWHPKYVLWIQTNGTIRCTNLFSMTTHPLVAPGESGAFDPIGWPQLSRDTQGCYTQVCIQGTNIRAAILRQTTGTLARGWNATYDSSWTLSDFQQPKDAFDTGSLSSVTTSSVVVTSDSTSTFWSTNFWNDSGRAGWITLIYPGGTGITITDTRKITACTSLTAGGTSTISWDSSDPIDSLSYTKYEIRGNAGGKIDVGRLWTLREPVGPQLGSNTYVGSHMVPRFPIPMPFSNNGKSFNTSTPVGVVLYSTTGSAPYIEVPVTFEIIPSTGQIRLSCPIWQSITANSNLASGEPTTPANGQYADLVIMLPYNRGGFNVYAPGPASTNYSGTAYTVDGISRVKLLHLDEFNYAGLNANMAILAAEYLAVFQDAIIEGSVMHHGIPAGFDPLAMGYALNLSIAGTTSPWDGVNLPVRSVTVRWPQGTGDQHTVTFNVSNRRRPFQGDDLYIHPMELGGGGGVQGGQLPFDQGQMGWNSFNGGGVPLPSLGGFGLGGGEPDMSQYRTLGGDNDPESRQGARTGRKREDPGLPPVIGREAAGPPVEVPPDNRPARDQAAGPPRELAPHKATPGKLPRRIGNEAAGPPLNPPSRHQADGPPRDLAPQKFDGIEPPAVPDADSGAGS